MADKSLEEVKRGEQATQILDNPIYKEAWIRFVKVLLLVWRTVH